MKATWSHKTTKCSGCPEPIKPGEQRVDEVYRIKGGPSGRGQLISVHWHLMCLVRKLHAWWEEHPYQVWKRRTPERTKLSDLLTPTQVKQRHRIISAIYALAKYYTEVRPVQPHELARIQRFNTNLKNHLTSLIPLGGVPTKYKNMGFTEVVLCDIGEPPVVMPQSVVAVEDEPVTVGNN